MADESIRPGAAPEVEVRGAIWNDPNVRAIFYQLLVIVVVIGVAAYLVHNTITNLSERGIRSGFGFLGQEAGFYIGESLISYDATQSYGRAFVVGLLNTLQVAVLGIVFATIIGTIIGIARLSHNWLIAKLASVYVETVRNIPLLLQLFFWYSVVTGLLPPVREAIEILPGAYLSKSGFIYPVPVYHPAHLAMLAAFLIGLGAAFYYWRWAKVKQETTGQQPRLLLPVTGFVLGLPLLAWLIGGAPTGLDMPVLGAFRFTGGSLITPEFISVLLGLTSYTAGFIAEIVRSGILSVPWGQTEAARSLGLRQGLVLRLVLLPQALRVIVPPMTSQFLNLTKNSSLAVAIGYPDLVSVTNTTLNQTGQAVECVSLIMLVYLTISLTISLFMNWYNKSIALVER